MELQTYLADDDVRERHNDLVHVLLVEVRPEPMKSGIVRNPTLLVISLELPRADVRKDEGFFLLLLEPCQEVRQPHELSQWVRFLFRDQAIASVVDVCIKSNQVKRQASNTLIDIVITT